MRDIEQVRSAVTAAHQKYGQAPGGANADYIPFLAEIPSHLSAVAVVTAQGQVVSAGDDSYRFALESISEVCTLALALEDCGPEAIHSKIGAQTTGLPFNSVIALELHGGKPLSPLVNAGAMSATSLVKAASQKERWQRVLQMQQALGSAEIALSDALNQSEQTTNAHNRAIAWLLSSAGYMYCDPMEACEVYTRQCSTLLNTVELATMGATLAAGGLNPISQQRVLKPEHVPKILAEMTMEGMYESSGDWAFSVGLPGKSGVGGGIVAVVPGVMGIAAFSPPLDKAGNSVRGQKMVAHVAQALGYNLFRAPVEPR